MKLEIVHSTRYRYSGPIAETVMEVRLRPMDGNGQRCLDFHLELSHGVKARTYVDGFGNHVHYFNLVRPHSGLSVISRSTVETGLGPDPEPGEELVQDFLRFRSPVKEVDGVRELARREPNRRLERGLGERAGYIGEGDVHRCEHDAECLCVEHHGDVARAGQMLQQVGVACPWQTGQMERFEGFLGGQATHLFEMTKLKQ